MKRTILMLLALIAMRGEALAGRPHFPPAESKQVYDPRFTFMAGAAYPQYSLDATEQAISLIEAAAQSPVHYPPETGKIALAVGCRLRLVSRLFLWGQVTVPTGGDGVVEVSSLSMSALLRIFRTPNVALLGGAGVATQKLDYAKSYGVAVGTDGGTLNSIHLATGGTIAYPVDLLIELQPTGGSPYSLIFNVRRILADQAVVGTVGASEIAVNMDAWVISAYFDVGF